MQILFKDDDIIVFIKPAGVLSETGGAGAGRSVSDMLPGISLFAVHRLDRETSGIMVYALNKKSAAALSKSIAAGGFDKKYYAVLKGSPAEAQGLMEDWLIRDPKRNLTEVTDSPCERAKRARAEYKIKAENQGLCLTDIRLLTGRTHQIRAQFSHRSCPVYGDSRYGGGSGELALFAHSLAFDHPATGERMIFTALPDCEKFPWNLFAQEDFSV